MSWRNIFKGRVKSFDIEKTEPGPPLRIFDGYYQYIRNPRNGTLIKAIVLGSADSVNVVAITKEQELILVEQFRFGSRTICWELPGAMCEDKEFEIDSARRELLEETGYGDGNWEYLGFSYANPVYQSAKIHHVMAQGVTKLRELELDDGEDI